MNAAQLIILLLQVSLAVLVASLAMRSEPGDMTYLLRKPGKLLRSVLAMFIVVPTIAAVVATALHLNLAVEVALILLAVSPVPPVLPAKQGKAGGSMSYALGLLMCSAVLAIVTVPLSVWLMGQTIGREAVVPLASVAKTVGISVIGPLLIGMAIRRFSPAAAAKLAGPLGKIATLLVLVAFLPVLIKLGPALMSLTGDFTLVAIVVMTLVGLLVGHFLGGPEPEDKTVLALASACRHPGVAITVATAVAAPENKPPVIAAIMLCLLVATIVTGPYAKWRAKAAA